MCGLVDKFSSTSIIAVSPHPTVLVIGTGHSGLDIAARLKYLGVPHLIIEKKAWVGDNVSCHRDLMHYDSETHVVTHTGLAHSNTVLTLDQLVDWLEGYADYLELNMWTSPVITKTEWDNSLKTWTVKINKDGKDTRILKVKHLVFATGYGGHPKSLDIPGKVKFQVVPQGHLDDILFQEDFKGEVMQLYRFR
ncbi:hypothetical protein JVT61DRAFT_9580 [Boletus reticuloceps]|uniref:FAD/NAD(P)-binding domain-containing protein n=1 Tax=Boletus reticuloceps TaxID=495285 RepID=A0A8I2YGE8_9AGAM|nr:hypothetical protein JVT61DRAFT_9580 [Boletus reticuloceps]